MKRYLAPILLLVAFHASAVRVNPQGVGEVLLVPYYTVNNGLNTTVTVTNTTEEVKAIKINIRESLNGYSVSSYNVYLSAFDSWSFVMGAYPSSADGYAGQEFAALASSDNSCAPMLNKSAHEFNPHVLVNGSEDINRGREGFIEIIEMGVLEGQLAVAATMNGSGVPNNCALLESAWDNAGSWDVNPNRNLLPVTGGLTAEVDMIDVAQGINYSLPVVALEDFFAEGSIHHTEPGDDSVSLDLAAPMASVYANKKSYQLSFERGIDAVSAVLMADKVMSTYNYEADVSGQNETVYTQPTRRFYQSSPGYISHTPFPTSNANGCSRDQVYGGVELQQAIWDRESQYNTTAGGVGGVPQPPNNSFCGSVFVQSFVSPGSNQSKSPLTQSNNFQVLFGVSGGSEQGFTRVGFVDTRPLVGIDINTDKTVHLMGLPIIGVTLKRFTNNNAAPGIMAQYGFSQPIKTKSRLIEVD
ncbi:MAG: hypothetical protein OQK49_05260 [Proteobacteria bacterium]|nr:hypothetical protein [Pseudomonadota bacterium]